MIWYGNAPRLPWNDPVIPEFTRPEGARLRPFVDDRVRFVGHPIAVVVAETIEQARFAASLVNVTYADQRAAIVDFGPARQRKTARRRDRQTRRPPTAPWPAPTRVSIATR